MFVFESFQGIPDTVTSQRPPQRQRRQQQQPRADRLTASAQEPVALAGEEGRVAAAAGVATRMASSTEAVNGAGASRQRRPTTTTRMAVEEPVITTITIIITHTTGEGWSMAVTRAILPDRWATHLFSAKLTPDAQVLRFDRHSPHPLFMLVTTERKKNKNSSLMFHERLTSPGIPIPLGSIKKVGKCNPVLSVQL